MSKKLKVGLVQVNFSVGPKEKNAYYLPYTVGVLWEYVNKFKEIKQSFELGQIIWKRDLIRDTVECLKDHDIVLFSTYIWNKSYNYALAQELREKNKNILIIFGGPEPPVSDIDFFKKFTFIDIMVKKEGEITFYNILKNIKLFPEIDIKGLLINKNGNVIDTGETTRINSLDEIPSPYINGFFEKIMKKNPDVEWNMTLETDRGCPFSCTFCDWGGLIYNKIKQFELDRVFKELEWAGKNKVGFISMTNANFGMFAKRDGLIVDKILEVQKKYRFPYTFSTAWAKNQRQEVIDLIKKLIDSPYGYNQGLTVSVQSMSEPVLDAIKRKNMEMNKIEYIFKECESKNIPVYTELILGLPEENLLSWKLNFYKLFEAGNHTGITVFQTQLLENAEMNISQRKSHDIISAPVYDYMEGDTIEDSYREGVDIVIANKDLPYEKMLDAQVWSWFMITFHINGLTSFISRFLFKHNSVHYSEFYEKLFKYIDNNDWWKKEKIQIRELYDTWMQKGEIEHINIGGVKILGWNLIYKTTASIMIENMYKDTWDMIDRFCRENFTLETKLHKDLMLFQNNYFIKFEEINSYPKTVNFKHDIYGYLQSNQNLFNEKNYRFDFLDDKDMTRDSFVKYLYFFRRRNFGKAWISEVSKIRKKNLKSLASI